jgi:uncharacterized protein (DUF305 family)
MKTRWRMLGVALTLGLLVIVSPLAATSGRAQMGPSMGPPLTSLSGDDFDKAFLQQMTMHHSMAVMMARPVAVNAIHPELKDLAQGIITAQTDEIAQMRGWANDWYGLDVPDYLAMMDQMMGTGSGTGMPGMHRPGMGPGMGMPGQSGMPMGPMGDMSMMQDMSMMASLSKLPPARLEVVFLSQMIPHHQGALDMAKLVPDRAAHQEVKDLAGRIIEGQSAEIDTMNGWLGIWYGL